MNPLVRFSVLLDFEIPYSELEHLMVLPVKARKEEVLRIILTTTPANRNVCDFELKIVQDAVSLAYWESFKTEHRKQQEIERRNSFDVRPLAVQVD